MKNFSKIAISIFTLAVATLAYFGYPMIKDRYLTSDEKKSTTTSSPSQDTSLETSDSSADVSDETIDDSEETVAANEDDTFLQVLPEDCKNGCKNFQDPDDITYCKQTCGLIAPKKGATNCDALIDLEKDYCLKDLAISKTDTKICDQIEDSGIKKTCQNRIVEDIVDTRQQ